MSHTLPVYTFFSSSQNYGSYLSSTSQRNFMFRNSSFCYSLITTFTLTRLDSIFHYVVTFLHTVFHRQGYGGLRAPPLHNRYASLNHHALRITVLDICFTRRGIRFHNGILSRNMWATFVRTYCVSITRGFGFTTRRWPLL